MELRQSQDCLSANEVTLKYMYNIGRTVSGVPLLKPNNINLVNDLMPSLNKP